MHLIFLTLYRGTEFKLAQNKPVSPTLLIGMLKTCHDRHMLGRSNLRSNRSHITYRKTALIEALFSHIQLDGDADPRLRRDSRRIERRLAIRENGRCILGFTELEKHQAALK
jgi:hypothetical protein